MCAIIEAKEVKIVKAIQDIVCYKYYTKNDDGSLRAWFRGHSDTKYKTNELYIDEIKFYTTKQEIGARDGKVVESALWKSQKGFHSAMSLSSCIEMIENKARPHSQTNVVICKCKIPQGSYYAIASEDYNLDLTKLDCYVSESLFIEKELFMIKGEDLNTTRKITWTDAAGYTW